MTVDEVSVVVPAEAGTQGFHGASQKADALDSRLRGSDGFSRLRASDGCPAFAGWTGFVT